MRGWRLSGGRRRRKNHLSLETSVWVPFPALCKLIGWGKKKQKTRLTSLNPSC